MSLLPAPADAAGLRRHDPGQHGRRHDGRRQDALVGVAEEGVHRQGRVRRPTWSRSSSPWPSGPAARACSPSRTSLKDVDDPFLRQGRHAGHRRHRPRGAARHPRGRGRRQAGRRQAGREVLRRRRRLRADHRHHRHRHGPGARAGEPAPSPRSSATSSPARSSRRCGASCSANVHLAAASATGSSGSASSRPPGWSSSIEGVAADPGRLEPAHHRPEAALAAARRRAARRRRRPDVGAARSDVRIEEEHENHERWLVTYADMVTLLMVLFIVHVRDEPGRPEEVQRAQGRASPPASASPTSVLDGSSSILDEPGTAVAEPIAPTRARGTPDRRAQGQRGRQGRSQTAASQQDASTPTPRPRSTGSRACAEAARRGPARKQGLAGRRHAPRSTSRGLVVSLVSRHVVFEPNLADAHPARPARRRHPRAGAARARRPAADRRPHQPGDGEAEVLRHRLGPLGRPRGHGAAPPERGERRPRPSG